MKRIVGLLIILLVSFGASAQSGDVKTDTFKVEGNCDMCKKRIEDAAYVKGVKRAEWDEHSKSLVVVYKSSKTSPSEILKSIAQAGHSSDKTEAPEEAYAKLPECCHYKTNACNH